MTTTLNATLSALAVALRLLSWNLDALEKTIPSYEVVIEVPTSTIQELIIKYFPENHETMLRIAECESGGSSTVVNNNPRTGDYSVGLFQINIYGKLAHDRPSEATLKDAESNIRFAKELHDREGIRPWSCAKILGLR